LNTARPPALSDDTKAALQIFGVAAEPTALRQAAWSLLGPLMPAILDEHCELARRHAPVFTQALAGNGAAYREMVTRHAAMTFAHTLDGSWQACASERADQETALGLDLRARNALSQTMLSALQARLRASWTLSKRRATRLTDEAVRLLGFDVAVAQAMHHALQVRSAKVDAKLVRTAVTTFSALAGEVEASTVASLANLGRLSLELEASAMATAAHCKSSSRAALESVHRAEAIVRATQELSQATAEIHEQSRLGADAAVVVIAEAEESAAFILELQRASKAIHAIVDLIATIASRSNLLALNAAVEAARAGAAGRGFAVVAAEVKALSAQTSQATIEVRDQIAAINGIVDRTAAQIAKSGVSVGLMVDGAAEIARGIELQTSATGDIASNASLNVDTAIEVGEALAAVETTVWRTKSLRTESATLYEELSRQRGQLHGAMNDLFAVVTETPELRPLARLSGEPEGQDDGTLLGDLRRALTG